MNKPVLITILIAATVLAGAIAVVVSQGSGPMPAGVFDGFAKCLADKGIVMYGTRTCSWCQKQKDDLGSSFEYVNYVECTVETQKCLDEKISATPTWVFPDSERIEGYLTLEELSAKSGCSLPAME